MIYTAEAQQQVIALYRHYEQLDRLEAIANLDKALASAELSILNGRGADLQAPRPYPDLVKAGLLWLKSGRYWVAYNLEPLPTIVAVFHELADIPGRL